MCRDEETNARAELMELLMEQLDSLENQVHIEPTDQELQEFDQRESRICEL